ncbi:MAG: class I SAM-dependent rRNA methyltransferase, partial [Chloroflexi bacterium]|nr:class I SAM-dependent rRNA methyltransferase [Chloroflexota bacterium]
LEGLEARSGPLSGGEPPGEVVIHEGALRFGVNLQQGQKTGFYLDQRVNRRRVSLLAANRDVLDCFAYSGGFTTAVMLGGAASVLAIDSSATALEAGKQNLLRNGLSDERVERREADVFSELRKLRDQGRSFDMVILDPPKFAPTAAFVEKAARGYKDINLLGMKLLRPGGLLVTFSCSGGVSEDLFQKIVAGAALDAGVQAQIIERLGQAPDHPVALNFPEGAYLKGLVLRIER